MYILCWDQQMRKTHCCSVSCCLQGTTFLHILLRDFLWCILHNFGFKWVPYINTQLSVLYLLFVHNALISCHMTVHWAESAWDLWLIHQVNTLTTEDFKVLGLWWTRDVIYHNQKRQYIRMVPVIHTNHFEWILIMNLQ
jgi:hypothetical protein